MLRAVRKAEILKWPILVGIAFYIAVERKLLCYSMPMRMYMIRKIKKD